VRDRHRWHIGESGGAEFFGDSLNPFFITGLPRSRTAWMAAFLTGGDVLCHHELMKFCPTRECFYQAFRHPKVRIGNSDSGLPLTEFQRVFPDAPTVIIERDIEDVYRSLHDIGIPIEMRWLVDMQERIAGLNGMRVEFDNLDRQLADICNHIGLPYRREKHDIFRHLIVVTNDFTPDNYGIWR